MDRLERGINDEQSIRVVAATTTELTRVACQRHGLHGVEAVILGRSLTAGCLLTTLTKNTDERVRIDLDGGGAVGKILVDSHADGYVRGCLQRRLDTPTEPAMFAGRPTIGDFVGRHGQVVVTRDVGLEQQYQGTVDLTSGEIDIDIERYLSRSEQLPSLLACEVVLDARGGVLRAGGVLCQTFPGADPHSLDTLRANVHAGGLWAMLQQDRTSHELMGFALCGEAFSSKDQRALEFACQCSEQRALEVLSTLGADEIEELAHEPGETEVRCSYCGTDYRLRSEQLVELAARMRQDRS